MRYEPRDVDMRDSSHEFFEAAATKEASSRDSEEQKPEDELQHNVVSVLLCVFTQFRSMEGLGIRIMGGGRIRW